MLLLYDCTSCAIFVFPASCDSATVDNTVSQVTPNVTVTFNAPPVLEPVHPSANRVTLHLWNPGDIELSVSDDTLERVLTWKSSCTSNTDPDRYQTARITATTNFISGNNQFTANILPLVAHRVSN